MDRLIEKLERVESITPELIEKLTWIYFTQRGNEDTHLLINIQPSKNTNLVVMTPVKDTKDNPFTTSTFNQFMSLSSRSNKFLVFNFIDKKFDFDNELFVGCIFNTLKKCSTFRMNIEFFIHTSTGMINCSSSKYFIEFWCYMRKVFDGHTQNIINQIREENPIPKITIE